MDKQLALRLMMLLSALESFCLTNNQTVPDYLLVDLGEVQKELQKVVLG